MKSAPISLPALARLLEGRVVALLVECPEPALARRFTREGSRVVPIAPIDWLQERSAVSALFGEANPPAATVFTTMAGTRALIEQARSTDRGQAWLSGIERVPVMATSTGVARELLAQGITASLVRSDLDASTVTEWAGRWSSPGTVFVERPVGAPEWSDDRTDPLRADWPIQPVAAVTWTPSTSLDLADLVRRVFLGRYDMLVVRDAVALTAFEQIALAGALSSESAVGLDRPVLVSDPLVAQRATAVGFRHVHVAPGQGDAAIVQAVASILAEVTQVLDVRGARLEIRGRSVRIDGEVLRLSDREHDVLVRLAAQPGVVVAKQELVRTIWGDDQGDPHLAEVSIARLRQRFGANGWCIETVVRRGYRLAAT